MDILDLTECVFTFNIENQILKTSSIISIKYKPFEEGDYLVAIDEGNGFIEDGLATEMATPLEAYSYLREYLCRYV